MTEAAKPDAAGAVPDAKAAPDAGTKAADAKGSLLAAKPADGKQPDANAKPDAKPDAKPAVPEKYELKAPKGAELKPEQIEAFAKEAKDLGLSQEQAQKLLERDVGARAGWEKSAVEGLAAQGAKWADEVRAHPQLGGKNLDVTVAKAHEALLRFAPQGLRDELAKSPLGNHPGLVELLYNVGRAMSEDGKFVKGGASNDAKPERTPASILYPDMNKK